MAFSAEVALDYLVSSHKNGRLAHAYLVTGPQGSGKEELARKLICHVNGLPEMSMEELLNQGVHFIRPESKSRRIKVEAIRELEKSFHMSGNYKGMKVGVVMDAERLQVASENAFLKTLEEPPDNCLLLLITAQPEQLLDTIISRCIGIPLISKGRLPLEESHMEMLETLSRHFRKDTSNLTSSLLLMKRFSALLKGVKEGISKSYDAEFKEEVKMYQKTTDGDWLKQREEYYKALTESEYIQHRNQMIDVLVGWFGDAMRQQNGYHQLDYPEFSEQTKGLAASISASELARRLSAIESLRDHMDINVQEQLAMEVAFMNAFS